MQQRLALARAAMAIARLAIPFHLRDVAGDLLPALDLAGIVLVPAAHPVAAIPLEPATRIVGMNPAHLPPDDERLGGVNAEEIERRILGLG